MLPKQTTLNGGKIKVKDNYDDLPPYKVLKIIRYGEVEIICSNWGISKIIKNGNRFNREARQEMFREAQEAIEMSGLKRKYPNKRVLTFLDPIKIDMTDEVKKICYGESWKL